MDAQSATIGDATPLPELSFDDLLDISPAKKNSDSADDDPLGLDSDKLIDEDDTLNTPGRKRPLQMAKIHEQLTTEANDNSADSIATTTTTEGITTEGITTEGTTTATVTDAMTENAIGLNKEISSAASTITISTNSSAITTTAATNSNVNILSCKTIKPPVVLNTKNILPKTATPGGQYIKFTKASTVGALTGAATSVTTSAIMSSISTGSAITSAMAGKTAVKTANGQIIFIQKSGGIPTVRLQTKPGATGTNSPSSSTATVQASTAMATTATATGIVTRVTTATMTTKASASTITTAPITTQSVSVGNSSSNTGNKMIGFQIMRTANGSIVPVKTFQSNAGGTATVGGSSLTLSPKLSAAQLTGKKFISTSGGQLVIKTPLKTVAPLTTASTASGGGDGLKNVKFKVSTSTVTSTTSSSGTISISSADISSTPTTTGTIITKLATTAPTTNATAGTPTVTSKFVMQNASGKSVVVSKQNIIKLSPSTTKTGEGASSGGQLHAIQIPGKQGLQYVRVLPQSKISTLNTSVSSAVTTTTGAASTIATAKATSIASVTTVSTMSSTSTTTVTTTTTGTLSGTSTGSSTLTSTSTTSAVKVINSSIPQKFTVVRPSSTGKIMLTQSPKKDGNVTFLPVTSKVHKTLVALPKVNMPVSDRRTDSPISSPSASNSSGSLIRGSIGPTSGSINIIKKHKISEINKEISRVIGDDDCKPPIAKKPANGSHIVLMPRSMLRSVSAAGASISTISAGSSSSSSFQSRPGTIQRVTVQGTPIGSSLASVNKANLNTLTSKKLYSVLKNNNMEHAHDKMKSLIICGQSQARVLDKKTVHIKRQVPINWAETEKKMQMIRSANQLSGSTVSTTTTTAAATTTTTTSSSSTSTTASTGNSCGIISNKSSTPPTSGTITVALQLKKESGYKRLKQVQEPTDTGPVRRKHCNCSKSQCLKLYCDCFANGEFCQDCTCKDCFNNLQYEDERQRAIKSCLERNPSAFKPKITTARDQSDMRLHNKGCNCKRSGCLKNYCECYEAKIPCSSNCKCVGCRNVEDRPDLDFDPDDCKQGIVSFHKGGVNKRTYERSSMRSGDHIKDEPQSGDENEMNDMNNGKYKFGQNEKTQCNFITTEVIDATLQCMITQADECEKNGLIYHQTEKMVLEEFGRCLVEIIDFSIRNTDSSFTQEN